MLKRILIITGLALGLTGCATSSITPMQVSDAPANRVYWTNFAGAGYRIKVSRDAGQMGSLCMTQVSVDGKHAADLGQAESVVFKVSPGSHKLRASPSLATSVCKNFYSAAQFDVQVAVSGAAGDVRFYRYGFNGSGIPFLSPSAQ